MSGPTDGSVVIDPSGSPACQTVSANSNPTWDWNVTPKSTAELVLHINLMEVTDCSDQAPVVHKLKDIVIHARPKSWWDMVTVFADRWKVAILGVLAVIAAAGAAYQAWFGRKKDA